MLCFYDYGPKKRFRGCPVLFSKGKRRKTGKLKKEFFKKVLQIQPEKVFPRMPDPIFKKNTMKNQKNKKIKNKKIKK